MKDLYSVNECAELRSAIEQSVRDHTVTAKDAPAENATKTLKVDLFTQGTVKGLLKKFSQAIIHANNQNFKFNIFPVQNNDILNYNVYNSEDSAEYSWHMDGVKDQNFDIKLTALLNLSAVEYTGGDFSFFYNGPVDIPEFKSTGSILIFPAWVPHRVTPVLSGQRISLAQFISGPLLR
jgi:PKHD-type hydroxylase